MAKCECVLYTLYIIYTIYPGSYNHYNNEEYKIWPRLI